MGEVGKLSPTSPRSEEEDKKGDEDKKKDKRDKKDDKRDSPSRERDRCAAPRKMLAGCLPWRDWAARYAVTRVA
jgi:hypothetical protein